HPDTAPTADGDLAVVRPMRRYGHGGGADAALVRATCVADREPFVAKGGVGPGEGDLVAVSALGVVEQIELIDDDPLSRGPSLEADIGVVAVEAGEPPPVEAQVLDGPR